MTHKLWNLRYHSVRGVKVAAVEAADPAEAEAVGRAWCEAHSIDHYRFISLDGPVVVAGPEILTHGIARDMFDSAGEAERSEAEGSPAAERPPDDGRGTVRPRPGPRATA
jgi:hypothetical protein